MSLPTEQEIIRRMASGARIVATDEGDGYSYKLIDNETALPASQILDLLDRGLIYSSNTAYFLTEEGQKLYASEPTPTEYYCPEHKYNPPPNSGFAFCPQCEIVAGNWGRGGFNVGVYIDQD